eukprot:CAMPEP_0196657826 /NCGR_PEP_ID=MMETSP1086-20130531/25926_1 /TAXON_ID=77921 /ORGANISM="Cyanoptyche  gloeocystis , Strain SAG4.97" /LENGTH=330 /DNA_ID=CAMNT_0041991125 /DNA_START=60 /DNA_END=1048 /DNA_ORIENTATION=-
MSILAYEQTIQEGSSVYLYENYETIHPIIIRKGSIFQCRFGAFHHADLIGLRYGSKIFARTGMGWMYCLAPTAELWTIALTHRTQILYAVDISIVCMYLELKPGCVVLESGTGSGSLSTSIARTVAPNGHLYTFEFHELRAKQAQEDFKANKLQELITVTHRDVCKLGFGMSHVADAIFLDLPSPWVVVPSASEALKPNGMLCSFSPCIEQVQKTCEALREAGFAELQTLECLLRIHDVKPTQVEHMSFGDEEPLEAGSSGPASGAGPTPSGAHTQTHDSDQDGQCMEDASGPTSIPAENCETDPPSEIQHELLIEPGESSSEQGPSGTG